MTDNQIIAGTERQAQLEAAKAAFFAAGNQIVELAGFTYKPLPFRKHPEPSSKIPKCIQQGARQQRSKERAVLIAEMAKTMTCQEVSEALGVPKNTLWTMSKREGFTFVPGCQGRRKTPYNDDAADAKLAERITALRDVGLSRRQAQKHIGIGESVLIRIIKTYCIDFPKHGERK